ncbi:hypothetical protein SRRS_43770 [Sporomusa rhizae]|uniref:hypothetical protein n=1 Tax=Sporomusa rhizae TaxID=357999 RepID=UPI00352A205C
MFRLIDIVLFVILVQFFGGGFFAYLLLREIGDAFCRYRKDGVISSGTIKFKKGSQEIALGDVNNIEGGYERSFILPFTVFIDVDTKNGLQNICLDDEEIVKFVKTDLNQITISTKWDIDKKLISITPAVNGEEPCILYNPVGKYALEPYMPNLLGFLVFTVAVGGLYFKLFGIGIFCTLFAILALICFMPIFYKQVSVMINSRGVVLKNKNGEHFIAFNEISKAEKKIFQNRVITKNGDIVYFPKACYLLPEFVVEMTKGNNLATA